MRLGVILLLFSRLAFAGEIVVGKPTLSAKLVRYAEMAGQIELSVHCASGIAGGAEKCVVERKVNRSIRASEPVTPEKAKALVTRFLDELAPSSEVAGSGPVSWDVSYEGKTSKGGVADMAVLAFESELRQLAK